MKRLLLFSSIALAVSACQPEDVDVWCKTHTLDDVLFTRKTVNAMPEVDKRKYLKILNEGAKICGWQPAQ